VRNGSDYCLVHGDVSAGSETEALQTTVSPLSEPQLSAPEMELSRMRGECARLQKRIEREQQERKRLAQGYFELQKRCTTLTRVQVAAERLLVPQSSAEVYTAIQEVVANLVGSEQMGVFLFDRQTCNLRLVASCGIDSGQYSAVALNSSLIGRSAATGNLFIANRPIGRDPVDWRLGYEGPLTACIPLRRDGLPFGAIAIFGLLDHRESFDAEDVELFEAIAKWTSLALQHTVIGG
jgi:GAF domain